VTETDELLRALRGIRRRARGLAALEGFVAGAAAGLAAFALGAAAWRARGAAVPWRLATLAGVGAAVLGAAVAAARPLTLSRCARLLDAALDRGGPPADRVLSALSFAATEAPLARAAVADALARARRCAPALVAPARRPRGLTALAGAALALVVVGGWPARAPGARRDATRPLADAPEARLRVAAEALAAERAEVVAAAEAAEQTGDVDLRALAREARTTLDALAEGALGRGQALDRLTSLAARAKEAADETAGAQAALRAAGKALDGTAATRALGHALGGDDADARERALDALASRAEASDGARDAIANALGAAASSVGGEAGGDESPAGPEGRRRLNREREASQGATGDGGHASSSERRLEKLRRDLDDAAARCRGGAAECAKRLRDESGGLRDASRQAARTAERRRLENAVRQLRERLRRGDLDEGSTERRFSRVARGEARPSRGGAKGERGGAKGERGGEASSEGEGAISDEAGGGEGGEEVFTDEPGGESAAEASEGSSTGGGASAGEEGAAVAGNGVGHEAGGEPLGAGATPPTRGHEREVRVRSSAGPTRSEVIEASARRGFAARDYVRVFDDYQPVVEEALSSGAVPEGRRYVVRRYFQLIRPRAASRAP